jgi:hypothetical protein
MVYLWLGRYREMSDGDMVDAFEAIAAKPDAFAYRYAYGWSRPTFWADPTGHDPTGRRSR